MSRRAIVVAGLSAVAIAASGCSGDSDAEAESPPATTTEQVDISKFRAAFKARFETTSWYGHITGMEMSSGRLEITTDLDAESAANETETVTEICFAALKSAFDAEALDGGETAGVIGSDGVVLGNCA